MAQISVTVKDSGEAYVSLVVGAPPEVRASVALEELEAGGEVPALDRLVLDFDFYGRLIGVNVTGSADSVLAPSLLDAAERD
jgi:hypothetical protein